MSDGESGTGTAKRSATMLRRLNIRQKLSLLLMLPLTLAIVTGVPFLVEQMDDARDAAATLAKVRKARLVGELIGELQQERLLALGYLVTPAVERGALVRQIRAAADATDDVRDGATTSTDAGLRQVLTGLDRLAAIRESVLLRAVAPSQVHEAYRRAVSQLIEALRLGDGLGKATSGPQQLAALDALLRANEQVALAGAALVVAAAERGPGTALVREAIAAGRVFAERFRTEAAPDQHALLAVAERGKTGRRLDGLTGRLAASGSAGPAADAVAATQAGMALRRVVQDSIIRDTTIDSAGRAGTARVVAFAVAGIPTVMLALIIWLSMVVGRSIAQPLQRLTHAATAVADLASTEMIRVADTEENVQAPRLAAVDVQASDEIGDLASAFNRVQATAALLMEQQVATRRNSAVMFANVARRTRGLVSRQLAFIDELERSEQDPDVLRSLYRLDHLTTRLRRSADSLLVISGTRENDRMPEPESLANVVRSAIAEIEGYQNVGLRAMPDVVVAPSVGPDLRLLLAELLENATTFSPPETDVEVSATMVPDCHISIVDHGIGMTDEQLAQENRRLVERERLDVAPTGVLGLFVVGRLARRHGLAVRLCATPGQGVTAVVVVPAALLRRPIRRPSESLRSLPAAPAVGPAPAGGPERQLLPAIPEPMRPPGSPAAVEDPDFPWFSRPDGQHGPADPGVIHGVETPPRASADEDPAPDGDPAATAPPAGRAGLKRRRPGRHVAALALDPTTDGNTRRTAGGRTPERDPATERASLAAFQSGAARATPSRAKRPAQAAGKARSRSVPEPSPAGPVADNQTRGGLRRRVPGANLAESARLVAAPPGAGPPVAPVPTRDAEAERAAIDSFIAGLHRAGDDDNNNNTRDEQPSSSKQSGVSR